MTAGREPTVGARTTATAAGRTAVRARDIATAGGEPTVGERLHVDWTACDGRGLCVELLPEVLDRDEWGYPLALDGSREPVVPEALRPHAHRAVADCPRLALRLLPR